MSSCLIHVKIITFLFFLISLYIVCSIHAYTSISFICSSAPGHLSGLSFFAVVDNAAVNEDVPFVLLFVSLSRAPGSELAGR